jgi:predicted dinucleotide-binding enzyme
MADPVHDGQQLSGFMYGEDMEAKAVVRDMARELGFELVDVRDMCTSWPVEGLARVWINLAYERGLGLDLGCRAARAAGDLSDGRPADPEAHGDK